jgi:MFS family permease
LYKRSKRADSAGRPGPRVKYLTEGRLVACGLIAATQMSWGSVVPVLPHYTQQFGMGTLALGAIIASFGVGRLIINIPAGILSRHVRQWPFLLIAVGGVLVCTILTGLMSEFVPVLALRFIAGIFSGAAITVGQALVLGEAPPQARGRVGSLLQAVQLAGAALGPALGGAAMSLFGVLPAFLAASSGCAAFITWALIRFPQVQSKASESPSIRQHRPPANGSRFPTRPVGVRYRRVAPVLALAALNGVGFVIFSARFGGQQSLVPLLSVQLAAVPAWQLGLGLAAITVVSLALLPIIGAVSDRVDRRWILAPSLALSAALTPLYLLAHDPLAFLAVMIGVGICGSQAGGLPLAALADAVSPRRFGVMTGLYRTFGDLGTILGPIALTSVLERFGAAPAVLTLAGLTLVGAVLACVRIEPYTRSRKSPPSSTHVMEQSDLVRTEVPRAHLKGTAVREQQSSVS